MVLFIVLSLAFQPSMTEASFIFQPHLPLPSSACQLLPSQAWLFCHLPLHRPCLSPGRSLPVSSCPYMTSLPNPNSDAISSMKPVPVPFKPPPPFSLSVKSFSTSLLFLFCQSGSPLLELCFAFLFLPLLGYELWEGIVQVSFIQVNLIAHKLSARNRSLMKEWMSISCKYKIEGKMFANFIFFPSFVFCCGGGGSYVGIYFSQSTELCFKMLNHHSPLTSP